MPNHFTFTIIALVIAHIGTIYLWWLHVREKNHILEIVNESHRTQMKFNYEFWEADEKCKLHTIETLRQQKKNADVTHAGMCAKLSNLSRDLDESHQRNAALKGALKAATEITEDVQATLRKIIKENHDLRQAKKKPSTKKR